MEYLADYAEPGATIEMAKEVCGITTPNDEMNDEQIRTAIKWIAQKAPDTVWADNKPIFGKMGIGVMLFLALTEFPEFYEKYELGQRN